MLIKVIKIHMSTTQNFWNIWRIGGDGGVVSISCKGSGVFWGKTVKHKLEVESGTWEDKGRGMCPGGVKWRGVKWREASVVKNVKLLSTVDT